MPRQNLKTCAICLLGFLLIGAGLGAIIYAFYPLIIFPLGIHSYPYPNRFHPEIETEASAAPAENRLVIPIIGIDVEIVEGEDESALSRGAWREPGTGVPGEDENTVISGHRFLFRPPNNKTFYLLDKLAIGDEIIIYWEGSEYDYLVTGNYEIEPEEVSILEKGEEQKLTLYTCAPLFSEDKRLVIEARPVNEAYLP